MKGNTKYYTLDRTLKYLSEEAAHSGNLTTSALSKQFETEYHVMHNLVQHLADKGYVDGKEVTPINPDYHGDIMLSITPNGRYFLLVDGGFAKVYRKERLDETWKIVSIVASIVNAIALLILSIKGMQD